MQSQIDALKSEVNDSTHVETGWLDCDDSDKWPTVQNRDHGYHGWNYFDSERVMTATFKSAYKSPPVVFLSISDLAVLDVDNIMYGIQVLNVSSQGFTMRCGANDGSKYRVQDMEVTWIAVPYKG